MYKNCKNSLGIAAVGLLTITTTVSAATVNFEIDFFEENVLVGSGSFSYDDEEQLTCLYFIDNDYRCYSESELVESFGDLSLEEISQSLMAGYNIFTNVLTDFSVNIYGVNYEDNFQQWWANKETKQQPGEIRSSRLGDISVTDRWTFGISDFTGVNFLSMDNFEQTSENFGRGTWYQSISPVDNPAPPDLPVEPGDTTFFAIGTFEARRLGATPLEPPTISVSEPSNIFGALLAIIIGYWAKPKLYKNKQYISKKGE